MFSLSRHRPGLMLLLVAAALLPAVKVRGGDSGTVLPRGVASPDLKTGYVANSTGGIDAIDLENGKRVSEVASLGLAVAFVDGHPLVLEPNAKSPNVLTINALDPETGKMIWRSNAITLPDGFAAVAAPGQSFGAAARVIDGELWVKWRARAWKPGAKGGVKTEEGAIRVDLKSQKAELLAADKIPPIPVPAGLSKELAKAAETKIDTPAGPEKVVCTVGKVVAAVDVAKDSVTLKRWDIKTENALDPVVLAKGGSFLVTLFLAAGAVLIRPTPPAKGATQATVWEVFSLETGKLQARFPMAPTVVPQEATILGSRLYFVHLEPPPKGPLSGDPWARQLAAVDLKTVRLLWSAHLDPTYDPSNNSTNGDNDNP